MAFVEQEKFVAFAKMIEELQEKIADIKAEMNEHFDGFIDENGLEKKTKKQLKSSVKKYLKWKKDRDKFNEEERIENEFIDILTGEKCIPDSYDTPKQESVA